MYNTIPESKSAILSGYLARGWALVPLHDVSAGVCSCGRDCRSAGKHPRRAGWQQPDQLVRDERTLAYLLSVGGGERWNWGVATGPASGIWVLDVDPASGGEDALSALVAELAACGESLPPTLTLGPTGGGGRHLVFSWPGVRADGNGLVIHGSQTKNRYGLAPGLDIRGLGGQIVVAPSVSGKGAYGGVLVDASVASVGPVLLSRLTRAAVDVEPRIPTPAIPAGVNGGVAPSGLTAARYRAYAASAVEGLLAELRAAPNGTRNDTAYRTACRLIELVNAPWSGLDVNGVLDVWWEAGQSHPDGYHVPDDELDGVWRRAVARVGGTQADPPGDDQWRGVGGTVVPFSSISSANGSVNGGHPRAPHTVGAETITFSEPGSSGAVAGQRPDLSGTGPDSGPGAGPAAVDPVEAMLGRMLTSAQLRALPPPEPLVNGLLDLDSCAWLIGEPGSGKTFVAIDLAGHVGRGEDWQGRVVRQGRVVYVVAEGARGMRLRVDAWEREYAPMTDVLFLPEPVPANERGPRGVPVAGAWSVLVEACRRVAPTLVVIDTQARATVGLNENDNSDMGYYAAQADRIRRATGACVLNVHHMGRNGTHARGASAIDGAQDAELSVSRAAGSMLITLKTDKQKDQAEVQPITLQLVRSDGGIDPATGRDLSSLVIGHVGANEAIFTEPGTVVNLGQRRMIDLYKIIYERFNGGAEDAGDGGTRADIRAAFAAVPDVAKLNPDARRKAFHLAWNGLLGRDLMIRRAGAERFKLVIVMDQTTDGVLTPNDGTARIPDGWNPYRASDSRT